MSAKVLSQGQHRSPQMGPGHGGQTKISLETHAILCHKALVSMQIRVFVVVDEARPALRWVLLPRVQNPKPTQFHGTLRTQTA